MAMQKVFFVLMVSVAWISQEARAASVSHQRNEVAASVSEADESSLKSMNLQISPVSWLVNRSNVSADFGVSDTVTIGPRFTYANKAPSQLLDRETGVEAGVRLNYYLNGERYRDGFVLKPAVYYSHIKRDGFLSGFLGSYEQVETKGPMLEFLGAYQLHLPSGLNFEWAAGFRGYSETSRNWRTSSSAFNREATYNRRPLVIELNIGYAL